MASVTLRRSWASIDDTYAIGYAFEGSSFHDARAIARHFHGISDPAQFESRLDDLNGFYSVITSLGDTTAFAVDQIASIPLFYRKTSDEYYISDDPSLLAERLDEMKFDQVAELEYLLSGYVTGRDTLIGDISQVLAGEYVLVSGRDSEFDKYHRRWFDFPFKGSRNELSKPEIFSTMDELLTGVYERVVRYADGRPLVVSLSGGHDSRVNLIMLRKLEYPNIIALTHEDREGESTQCKEIADDFGIPWIYVSRTHEDWFNWYNSASYDDFEEACRWLDRVPTLEGAFAVKTAKEQRLVPEDSIFLTGDGVISTGEHLPPAINERSERTPQEIARSIARSHYKYWEWDDEVGELLTNRVFNRLMTDSPSSTRDDISLFEWWDWQERQAKFIPRTHLFEYWGYDWWMPLWDREFIAFWSALPNTWKVDKRVFREYVESRYAQVIGVGQTEARDSVWQGNSLGQQFKHRFRNTRFDPVGTRFEKAARKVYYNLANPVSYEDDSMFGIMEADQFEDLRTGLSPIIHRFQVMEVLDKVNFDPPEIYDLPEGDTITLEYIGR